jgi:tetratricopeptide (TPR) repeat protein
LLWSVDTSLMYLLMGIAVFCFFQYFRTTNQNEPHAQRKGEARPVPPSGNQPLDQILENIQAGFRNTSKSKMLSSLFGAMGSFVFFVVIVIVIIAVASEDYTEYDTSFNRASDFFEQGNYDSALYYYTQAAREDPTNPEIYYERGNAFMNLSRYDSAAAMFTYALTLDHRDSDAQFRLAYSLYMMGRYRESVKEAKKLYARDTSYTAALLLAGDSYYTQQRYDSALYWYSNAYSQGYRSAILSHVIGFIYDNRGDTESAVRYYKEAVEQDGENIDVLNRLAELIPGDDGNRYRMEAVRLSQQTAN